MDFEGLIRRVPSEPLAVQLYAASPLAIGMGTDAGQYLRRLAHGLRLEASVVLRVHQCLGEGHAESDATDGSILGRTRHALAAWPKEQ
jgi:hypothetical protein